MNAATRGSGSRDRAAFTLAELMVAMAIIAVIATITVVAVGGIAKEARLSTGTNAVTSSLENARGLAMKMNRIVIVAFRARLDGNGEQVIEAVTAKWSGDTYVVPTPGGPAVVDRFEPVSDTPRRDLPRGIKIAAPYFTDSGEVDAAWLTSSNLLSGTEAAGVVVGVMYGPDGTRVYTNRAATAELSFIDFNADTFQGQDGFTYNNYDSWPDNDGYCYVGATGTSGTVEERRFFCQYRSDDEPYVTMAPFLAVYDDEAAREFYANDGAWSDALRRTDELSEFIRDRADRIHFNRYSGVVLR